MVGKLWWNLVFALIGALMVYIISIGENTLPTTAIRSSGTFIIFFLLLFLFRWAIGFAFENRSKVISEQNSQEQEQESIKTESNSNEQIFITQNEKRLHDQSNGELDSQNELSEEEAKKTSEMIRSLLDDE